MRTMLLVIRGTLQRGESYLFENAYRPYVMLGIVGALLYARTLFAGFTYLDDNVLILNNIPYLSDLGNIFNAFTHDVFSMMRGTTAYFRPLLTVSFMPEAIIGGSLPFFYHFTDVAIHVGVASLVYALFMKLKYSKRVSLLSALIFLVHPALTQAVAWIPGRNDSLLALFVLFSFIFFLNSLERGKRLSILWSVLFFSLALFTKETAIVLPVLCVGYLWIRHRLEKDTLIEFGAGWLIAALLWLPLRITAMTNPLPMSVDSVIATFGENVPGTLQLLGKALFPVNLSVLPILQDTTFAWGYAAVALIVALLLLQVWNRQVSKRSALMMLFGSVWFLAFLWPPFVISDPSGTTYFLEHRLYLPIIGLLILIAETSVVRVLDEPAGDWFLQPWLLVLVAFFSMTLVHERVFADRLTFWQNAAFYSPHASLAQRNLGAMYYLDKNYALAEAYSRKALALNAEEPMAHNNLGLVYASRGQVKEAEQEYLQELAVNPYYDSAHFNLGLLYYGENDFIAARKQWEETLRINPDYLDAWRALYVLDSQRK